MITTTNTYDISDSIKQWKVYWQPASLIEKGSDIWTQNSFNDILCFDVTKHKLMILNIQYNLICFDLILPNRMIGGLQILHNTWSHIKMPGDRSKPRKADLIQFLLKLFLWTVLKHEFCCRMLFHMFPFFWDAYDEYCISNMYTVDMKVLCGCQVARYLLDTWNLLECQGSIP